MEHEAPVPAPAAIATPVWWTNGSHWIYANLKAIAAALPVLLGVVAFVLQLWSVPGQISILRGEMTGMKMQIDGINTRIAGLESLIMAQNQQMDARLSAQNLQIDTRLAAQDQLIHEGLKRMDARLAAQDLLIRASLDRMDSFVMAHVNAYVGAHVREATKKYTSGEISVELDAAGNVARPGNGSQV